MRYAFHRRLEHGEASALETLELMSAAGMLGDELGEPPSDDVGVVP